MKRVELIGIPGSGKTTISNIIIGELKKASTIELLNTAFRNTIIRHYRSQGLLRYAKFQFFNLIVRNNYIPTWLIEDEVVNISIKHSNLIQEVNLALTENEKLERQKQIISLLLKDLIKLNYVSRRNHNNLEYVLSDELLSHRAMTIFYGKSRYEDISQDLDLFFERVGYPQILINLDCDPEVAFQRALLRSKGIPKNLSNMTRDDYILFLNNLNKAKSKVCEFMKKKGIHVIDVQSECKLEITITDIINKCRL